MAYQSLGIAEFTPPRFRKAQLQYAKESCVRRNQRVLFFPTCTPRAHPRHIPFRARIVGRLVENAGGMHTSSLRGRRRKNQTHSHSWDQAQAVRASLPRASRTPAAQAADLKRPYYNIIFGREQDQDIADTLVDTLDVVVPRDLAAARYSQNHTFMSQLLGPTRLDLLKAPPSPYEGKDPQQLADSIASLERELRSMRAEIQDKKKAFASFSFDDTEEASMDAEESWAVAPSQGPVLGIGYVPTDMPVEVAQILEQQRLRRSEREAQQHTQVPAAAQPLPSHHDAMDTTPMQTQ